MALLLCLSCAQAQDKQDCTPFWANFVGLEHALKSCEPTPRFNAWVKEEQARIARGELDKQVETKKAILDAPSEGNVKAEHSFKASDKVMSNIIFSNYLYTFCMALENLDDGEKEFKKRMIDPMVKLTTDGNIDNFWTEPGCVPRFIGDVMSPLIHVAAENSTDRLQFVKFLKKYYRQKGDDKKFLEVLNAKNTLGWTVLDYIYFAYSTNRFVKIEEAGVNRFTEYLCDHGVTYSKYNKSCPAEQITIKN